VNTDVLPKPTELLALHDVTEEMFDTLRDWFSVPSRVELNLDAVDSAVLEMGDPVLIAAMAMRKLQALHLLSTPGVRTTTDVVVTIVQDLDRALLQAPNMRLNLAAASTDWDAALAQLEEIERSAGGLAGAALDDDPGGHEGGAGAAASDADEDADDGFEEGLAVDDDDPEATRFRELHARLHEAMYAVLRDSGNEIRYFE
jgi:hypothetical protein